MPTRDEGKECPPPGKGKECPPPGKGKGASRRRAPFVTFEGVEGSGKTTQIRHLSSDLAAKGIPHLVTREPGGTPLADEIRNLLLSPRDEKVFPESELLLYGAARAQHVRGFILPALAAGRAVLCDRFCDATVAYQAHGRGIPVGAVERLNRFAAGGTVPDLTLLFDLPPETGFSRVSGRDRPADRMERESLAFHRAVRDGYLRLLDRHPERIVRLDASLPVEAVRELVREAVAARFGW